jgi:hypothetical protein
MQNIKEDMGLLLVTRERQAAKGLLVTPRRLLHGSQARLRFSFSRPFADCPPPCQDSQRVVLPRLSTCLA